MTSFSVLTPPRILFGRAEAAKAPALIRAFGDQGIVVHGATAMRAAWLVDALTDAGCAVTPIACPQEPTLAMVDSALAKLRGLSPQWVVALGGGAVLDFGKALAGLIPAPAPAIDYLEIVGRGLVLPDPTLPFIALPTTAGTGAEASKNAVIGLPDHGRKVMGIGTPGLPLYLRPEPPHFVDRLVNEPLTATDKGQIQSLPS